MALFRRQTADIQQLDYIFLGYYDGEKLAGLLAYEESVSGRHISRLAVAPTAQRRGIARRLIAHVERRAPVPRELTVSTAVANTPAVTLYKRLGFTTRCRTYLPDGLVLVTFAKPIAGHSQ